MKKSKSILLCLVLIGIILVSGCARQQTKYICSDGTTVSDSSYCIKPFDINKIDVSMQGSTYIELSTSGDGPRNYQNTITVNNQNEDVLIWVQIYCDSAINNVGSPPSSSGCTPEQSKPYTFTVNQESIVSIDIRMWAGSDSKSIGSYDSIIRVNLKKIFKHEKVDPHFGVIGKFEGIDRSDNLKEIPITIRIVK